jgi:hypothetical protein
MRLLLSLSEVGSHRLQETFDTGEAGMQSIEFRAGRSTIVGREVTVYNNLVSIMISWQ